jgi:hypothetical protein
MTKQVIQARVRQRTDTAANWAAANPVLLLGELGIISDNPDQYKVGDGVTPWNLLPVRGFDGNVTQQEGNNSNWVMSQKAVTEALARRASKDAFEQYVRDTNAALGNKASSAALKSLEESVRLSLTQMAQTTADALGNKAEKTAVETLTQTVTKLAAQVSTLSGRLDELSRKVDAIISGGGGDTPSAPSNLVGSAVVGTAKLG